MIIKNKRQMKINGTSFLSEILIRCLYSIMTWAISEMFNFLILI